MGQYTESHAVNGIDTYTFPSAIPPEVTILDRFPPQPMPQQFGHIRADLLGELAQATPDRLGRSSACILVGADQGYGGHSRTDIAETFPMALNKVPEGIALLGAMSIAIGDAAKEKHAMPTAPDFDRLVPLLTSDAKFCVLEPNRVDKCRIVPAAAIAPFYAPAQEEKIQGQTEIEARIELGDLTSLSPRECEFLAKLRIAGIDKDISYRLLGSGVGTKGQSAALHPGLYGDLDIVATSSREIAEITASFEALATSFYGPLNKNPKDVHQGSRVISGQVYSNPEKGVMIDFFAGNTLGDVLVRPEALARGHAIQIS